ncbi:MAG TPA: Y-family DNA polymerase [bacterium]|nr:Y-family DNA polymerase [bacterium]
MTQPNPLALVDCNNFYVSCERVHNPRLMNKPVIVLSNNDGMPVARSEEAKALGIGMAQPAFEIRDIIQRHKVFVFSSNYTLYGDLSSRVMETLRQFSPAVEEYSIDEAFVSLQGLMRPDHTQLGREIKERVFQWVGIPVSVGIATSKTLAKVANRLAKRSPEAQGVLDLTDPDLRDQALRKVDVADIWKCGPARADLFRCHGLKTAWDLSRASLDWVDKKVGVEGMRMVRELRGEPCIPLELVKPKRKRVGCARSFGRKVGSLSEVKEGLATHVAQCANRLRREGQVAGLMLVSLNTNPYSNGPQYNKGIKVRLLIPTDNTGELIRWANKAVEKIYKAGLIYKAACVELGDLMPNDQIQQALFVPQDRSPCSETTSRGTSLGSAGPRDEVYEIPNRDRLKDVRLMKALDRIGRDFGAGRLRYLSEGLVRDWDTRFSSRSARYTTRWEELLTVRAS